MKFLGLLNVIVLAFCLCFLSQVISADKRDKDEKPDVTVRLMREVFSNYERFFRPGEGRPNSTVDVKFGASLAQIRSLNEAEETLDAVFYFRVLWKDPRLSWNPQDFDGIDVIRVPNYMIWKPDLMIFNGVQGTQGAISLYADVNALVYSDGTVFYIPPIATKTSCAIDKASDLQTCTLKIGSWTYDGHSVDLILESDELDLSSYQMNRKWGVQKTEVVRHEQFYSCCEEPYVDATITLHLRRNN